MNKKAPNRLNIRSGSPWEPVAGYSRAVRLGHFIAVSGTTAVSASGEVVGGQDVYLQSRQCLETIRIALEKAGASLEDVVRTRIYTTDISQWEAIARAHREVFGSIAPATSMVEVRRLINPALLVEIEADAITGDGAG